MVRKGRNLSQRPECTSERGYEKPAEKLSVLSERVKMVAWTKERIRD